MQKLTPRIPTQPKSHGNKQTGPKTLDGKARSSMNALTHGMTSRLLVLPGEDPQQHDRFVAEITESLRPVGAAEEELARQFAMAAWKLRRTGRWEAAQARGQQSDAQQALQAQLEALDEQIKKVRSDLRQLQSDPASDPPLIVQLASMPDASLIYGYSVGHMFQDWLKSLPDETPRVTLTDLVRRMDDAKEVHAERNEDSKGADARRVDPPTKGIQDVDDEMDWTARRVRMLVAEMAKAVGVSTEQLYRDRAAQWRGELQDKRADRRQRQVEVRRQIKRLESQQQDLRVGQTMPDTQLLDRLTRYESATLRLRDKSLKALLELQDRRMSAEPAARTRTKSKG